MENIETNLNRTKELMVEYEKSVHIQDMFRIYEKLSLYSVFLGENLSELKKQYNKAYFQRKISLSRSFISNRSQKISERTSLEMATESNASLLETELEAEALAYRLETFLRQVNKVMEAMRSRISFEKQEKERLTVNDV